MIRYCCPVWAYVRNFLASAILLWSLWQKSPRKYGETKWESKAVIKCESEGSFKRAPPSNSIPGDYASSRVLLQVCYISIDNAIVDNMRTKKAYVHILSPTWVSKKIIIHAHESSNTHIKTNSMENANRPKIPQQRFLRAICSNVTATRKRHKQKGDYELLTMVLFSQT